jgi:hypothetical protein
VAEGIGAVALERSGTEALLDVGEEAVDDDVDGPRKAVGRPRAVAAMD